jgi:hypothetical protein
MAARRSQTAGKAEAPKPVAKPAKKAPPSKKAAKKK